MTTKTVAGSKKRGKIKLPDEIAEWEKQSGFEAQHARAAIEAGTSTAQGFKADLKWFASWYETTSQIGTRAFHALHAAEQGSPLGAQSNG